MDGSEYKVRSSMRLIGAFICPPGVAIISSLSTLDTITPHDRALAHTDLDLRRETKDIVKERIK